MASLTILFAILFNGQKLTLFIVLDLLIALTGVCWVLGARMVLIRRNYQQCRHQSLSYLLAFLGRLYGRRTARSQ